MRQTGPIAAVGTIVACGRKAKTEILDEDTVPGFGLRTGDEAARIRRRGVYRLGVYPPDALREGRSVSLVNLDKLSYDGNLENLGAPTHPIIEPFGMNCAAG